MIKDENRGSTFCSSSIEEQRVEKHLTRVMSPVAYGSTTSSIWQYY